MLIVNTAVRRQAEEEDVLSPLCFLSAGSPETNALAPVAFFFLFISDVLNVAVSLRAVRCVRTHTDIQTLFGCAVNRCSCCCFKAGGYSETVGCRTVENRCFLNLPGLKS